MEKLRTWLQSLTQHQRMSFLALFIIVTYFLWSSVWGGYYSGQQKTLTSQKKEMQDKITVLQNAQQKMKSLASDPDVLATKKKLEALKNQLQEVSRRLVSSKQMLEQLEGVLAKDPSIKFSHIQNAGSVPFSLEAPGQEPMKNQGTTNAGVPQKAVPSFYEHFFIITFEANYFDTQHYIEQLQKLPGQLYFDSIDYETGKYPDARVSIKVHTISLDSELINA